MQKRISRQQYLVKTFSDFSNYLNDFFRSTHFGENFSGSFTSEEICKVRANGLGLFNKEQKASIIERMANLLRKVIEKQYESAEIAHKYTDVFQNVKDHEHDKFLMNYMQAIVRGNIKESIKSITGSVVFGNIIWKCINTDEWKKYSIYSNTDAQSAFRSTNTIKFDTDNDENERHIRTNKCADLSFTSFGMENVLERSDALKNEHLKMGSHK